MKKNGTDILFAHGGPGLNCEPERRGLALLLASRGLDCTYWDEPSALRPALSDVPFRDTNAYRNWLQSLDVEITRCAPKVLVGISFGALGVMDYLKMRTSLVPSLRHVVMIAPTLNLNRVFQKMMQLSEGDFAKSQPDLAVRLRALRGETRAFWDAPMREALALVWQNPQLLTHYSNDTEILRRWGEAFARPGYEIDFASQNAVLADMAKAPPPSLTDGSLPLPLAVLYGTMDPVFDLQDVKEIVRTNFTDCRFEKWEGVGHFPHLERPEEFVRFLEQITGR
jgi:pimeloyl-ACP methyl ester carboxylesterase